MADDMSTEYEIKHVFRDYLSSADEELCDEVRRKGVLFYQDEHYAMYRYRNIIYLLEPSSFEDTLDRAVLEAGFKTEPLRHALHELYECLYVRMLSDGMTGFTQREYNAVLKAKELLGLT